MILSRRGGLALAFLGMLACAEIPSGWAGCNPADYAQVDITCSPENIEVWVGATETFAISITAARGGGDPVIASLTVSDATKFQIRAGGEDWADTMWEVISGQEVEIKGLDSVSDAKITASVDGEECGDIPVTVMEVDSVEVRDKNHSANSETTTGSTTPDLYVGETSSHNAVLEVIASVLPDTTETRSRVNWEIEGNDASPSSGNFGSSSTAEISIDNSSILGDNDFVVNVGGDLDDDGSLDGDEVTHSVNVHFIEFDDLKVFDKNNSSVSVTVNETSSSDELYICENLSGDTVITLDPDIEDDTLEFRSHVLWTITGNIATDSSGTFETASPGIDVTLAPDAGNTAREFIIKAGTDDDNNGTLDAEEEQYEVKVIVLKVESVDVCKPDAGVWDVLPWGQVLLAGEDLKLKVKITPGVSALSDFINACSPDAAIRTFTVDSSGTETAIHNATVTITAANATLQGTDEIRVTVPAADVLSLNLAAKAEDSTAERCSADSQSVTTGASHRRDSDGFDANATGAQRGLARGAGNISATPPEGEFSKTFIQAAGALCIDATAEGPKSEKRQIQEQSDVFYYSGHGNHANAMLAGLAGPSDVTAHWDDIDKAVIAGCAVLDVNDYNNRYTGADHTASPGEQWATTVPDSLLGYNWFAPLDDNVGDPDFTKDIIEGYLSSSLTGDVNKWMWANRDKAAADYDDFSDPGQRPWNACVLTRGATEWIYWYWDFNTLDPDGKPMLNHKHESEW